MYFCSPNGRLWSAATCRRFGLRLLDAAFLEKN